MTKTPQFYQKLARLGLGLSLVALILETIGFLPLIVRIMGFEPPAFLQVLQSLSLFSALIILPAAIVGLIFGLRALFAVRQHGKDGIYGKAWAAIIVSGLVFLPRILLLGGLAGGMVYGMIDEWRYPPAVTFESQRWNQPDLKYRFSALDIVIKKVIKPGMTEAEVTGLLGTPEAISADEDWQYEAQRPGWRLINWTGGGLLIKFDRNRRVTEAIDNTFVD